MQDSTKTPEGSLDELLTRRVVGQSKAIQKIVPFIRMFQAGLSPVGRPAGVFLLLGPTGTGKTRTVETLAEILHGTSRKVVRIDCGEFQTEHEVAKLVGSPPGYIGHRETQPILTQQRLLESTSEACDLALVLFDEIEKAAPAVAKLLLGILDKAVLRLGDNTEVNFEKALVFFTSNLGAREMTREMQPGLGFRPTTPDLSDLTERLEGIAVAAVRKMYSPEFVNRIDAVVTYQPLDSAALAAILDQQVVELQTHLSTRLGTKAFSIEVSDETRQFLLERGTSNEFGARELKRTIYRHLTQPLANLVIENRVEPGSTIRVGVDDERQGLTFSPDGTPGLVRQTPTLLIVDDNKDFLRLLSLQLGETKRWRLITAQSVAEADKATPGQNIDIALLDLLLSDGNGLKLGSQLKARHPGVHVIIMTGGTLTLEEDQFRRDNGFRLLEKPFLADDLMQLIELKRATANSA